MRIVLAGATVVALVAGIFLASPDPVANADTKAFDLLTGLVGRGKPSGQVTIVEIDEKSLAQLGGWPWPRDLLAQVVRRILDGGAATVALDMVLHDEDRGTPNARAGIEKAECWTGVIGGALPCVLSGQPVLAGYAFRFDGAPSPPSTCTPKPLPLAVGGPNQAWETAFFHARGALCSVPEISNAAAANGFLNAAPDSDGKLRQVPLVMEYSDSQFPSLALAALYVFRHASSMQLILNAREASRLRVGSQVVRLEGRSLMRLRFRGPHRTFPYVSAASVLNHSLPKETFQGKIVIVGGSAVGLPNPVVTPVDTLFPDVEVQATAIDNLLQGDSFDRRADFRLWEALLALLAGLASTCLLALVRSWWSAPIALGIIGGTWAGCALLLSRTGLLFSPLAVTAAVAFSFPVVTLLNYRQEKRRAERTERQLASSQEQVREVLREEQLRYRRLVENVNDAIIVDDAEGRLVFANRRFREWFGLEGRNIGEVILEDYVAPEWRAALRERHARRMRGESTPDHYEYEGVRPDGGRIWIEALVTNVEEEGRIAGTQAALRDATDRKRMEAQYLQAQKMESLGRLAGIVAHDFNNLLTVINGYSDLILTGRSTGSQSTSDLQQIRSAGEQATELTRHLLAFSRKQVTQPQALDLNALVAGAEKMFTRLIGEDIELIMRLSPALGQVMADPGQLNQVLMNLLVNARDAMPGGGSIVIETKNVDVNEDFAGLHPDLVIGRYVYLGVTDTGMGISDEVKRHLFEPFFTTKEPGKGTGLGLATVSGIVQRSEGRIEVTSKLGEGATFHIYLPRLKTEQSIRHDAKVSVASLRGSETVLVVEDQEGVRRYIRAVLEDSGYRVLEAANGSDALALSEQCPDSIHLLVTDLVLPTMNGWEVAQKLREVRPGVKMLFLSGYAEETIGSRGIIPKDVGYLPKPFTPEELTAKVREVLAVSGATNDS
jgi:PAS domain S-box-containing protein